LRFHYLVWNPAGEHSHASDDQHPACPIILHHGLASSARIWELVAPLLAEAGHPVYAIDARGHGLTDKPDDGYDFRTITSDLALLLDACQLERPLLVGHSWGASVGLAYAARFALGPRQPAGLVLVDGGLVQMDDGQTNWEETCRRLTPPKLAGMPVDEFIRRLKASNAHWQPSDEAVSVYLNSFEISAEDTIAPRLTLERHLAILRAMWEMPTHAIFAQLRCPALAIIARQGPPTNDMERAYLARREKGLEKLRQANPRARGLWMDDTVHDIPLQRPKELARAILEFAVQI